MHPLAPDLSTLTDEELHTKRSDLMNRLTTAYRMGSSDMVGQLQLLLQDYAMEVERRNQILISQSIKSGRVVPDSNSKNLTSDEI